MKPKVKKQRLKFFICSSLCMIFASLVSTSLLMNKVNGKNAYALRGFPGSDRSSVEFEALWTGPMWYYLVPGKNSRRWMCMEFERNLEVS